MLPLLGIAQRDFLEAYSIQVIGGSDMEVSVDDSYGGEALMPILCPTRPTPEREARDMLQAHKGLVQRKMVDKNHRLICDFLETLLRSSAACLAPGRARGIGIGVEERLVGTEHARLFCPFKNALLRDIVGMKTVVIQQEKWNKQRLRTLAWPDHVGVLRC